MPAPSVTAEKGPVRQRYGSKVPNPRPHPLPGPEPGLWARMIMSGMPGRAVLVDRPAEYLPALHRRVQRHDSRLVMDAGPRGMQHEWTHR